jgi:PKD repeat protein
MNKIKSYLLLVLLFMCFYPTTTAQNATEYNPGNPPEPENLFSLELQMNNTSAGYTSGSGNYPAGKSVRVIANVYSGYQFIAWREGDSVISTVRDFYYTMPSRKVSLKAHFMYTPSNPGEPALKYTLKLIAVPEGSGYFSYDNQFNEPGTHYSVYAYPHTGYVFKGWYRSDNLVSLTTPYSYTTGYANDTLSARFEYQPGNPGEPATGTGTLYNLSLLTPASEKGKTIAFPVHLYNRNTEIFATTFDLKFRKGALVDLGNATLSGRKDGHTLTTETLNDSTYRFAVTGPDTLALTGASGILVTIPVTIPQEWEIDKTYPVVLTNATVRTSTGTVNCPVKPGGIRVLSEEGALFASFYPDIYLNRAHFVNLSSPLAETYRWDFGDGTGSTEKSPLHSYEAGGPYTVRLWVQNGTQKDSAQFSIVITDKVHWRISGNFSLNNSITDVRNFRSADELFTLFSQSGIAGTSNIQVANSQTHGLEIPVAMKEKLSQLLQKLKLTGHTLSFSATDTLNQPVIDFKNTIDQEVLDMLIELWNYLPTDKVKFALQGVEMNSTAIRSFRSQQLCSGNASQALDFSVINPTLTYNWKRIAETVSIEGYLSEGQQILPSMTLVNPTEAPDTLTYEVSTVISGTTFTKLLTIKLIVLPLLSGSPVIELPAAGSEQASTTVKFAWSTVKNATYDLYIWEENTTPPSVPGFSGINTNNFTNSSFCKYGKKYKWKVVAKGTCDSKTSSIGTFTVRTLPDLQVLTIQHPADLYPGDQVTVKVTIKNKGGNTPVNSYWRDEIALSRNENLEGILSLNSIYGYRTVLSDSSYMVNISFVLPLDTIPYSRFVVRSDINNQLLESDETNNVFVSDAITILQPRIESGDYNRLRAFYQQTGGTSWNRRWNINSDVIIASNWPGVSFNRGRVSAINLNSNHLTGTLTNIIFGFGKLKRLELYDNQLTGNLTSINDSILSSTQLSDSLAYLHLGRNQLSGELSAFAARFPLLNYLNVSENRLSQDQALSSAITQLNVQYQQVKIDSMNMVANPVFDTLPLICRYNHANRSFTSWPGFSLLHQNNTVGYITYSGNRYNLSWNNTTGWRIPSGAALEIMQHSGTAYGARSPFKLFFIQGDANVDQRIDLLDVQHSLNYVLRNSPTLFNYVAANTFDDDQLTVQDIVTTVEMVLAIDSTTEQSAGNQRVPGAAPNELYIENNKLMMQNTTAVAALDVSLDDVSSKAFTFLINPEKFQFRTRDNSRGGLRLIVFSPDGSEFAPGIHHLAKFDISTPIIRNLMLSDRYATKLPARIGETITSSDETSANQFLLQQLPGKLVIRITGEAVPVELKLINLQGIVVQQQSISTREEITLNLGNDLPAGVYLLQLYNSSNTSRPWHFKVIISK